MLYEGCLAALILANGGIFARRSWKRKAWTQECGDAEKGAEDEDRLARRSNFLLTYLVAYLLATAADWLQGPHIYAIYRYDKGLEERTTAALYASGFVSGAVSSSFVGHLTDKFGRRAACVAYCAAYVVCCATMLSDSLVVLLMGRIFGGIATTLLFTSFETWMMAEYHKQGMDLTGLSTAAVFGHQATLNSVVAILSGVVGEGLVAVTGTRKAPFMLAGIMSISCGTWMTSRWDENFGRVDQIGMTLDMESITASVRAVLADVHVCALTAASCAFESMMYLFVFFWTAAITSARNATGTVEEAPYGLIFACFMCAMMLGSQTFGMTTLSDIPATASVLELAMALGSLGLLCSVTSNTEWVVFTAFCVVELCVGLYFPSMGVLKGKLIKDESRAKLYSLMRLPLNAAVLTTHAFSEEGDHHRNRVFLILGAGVLAALLIIRRSIL